jgi:hypothetical protein
VGSADRFRDLGVGVAPLDDEPGAFQVENQTGQRVGQHVVHFPGQALAFAEGGGLRLRGAGLFQLRDQSMGLLIGLPIPSGEVGE